MAENATNVTGYFPAGVWYSLWNPNTTIDRTSGAPHTPSAAVREVVAGFGAGGNGARAWWGRLLGRMATPHHTPWEQPWERWVQWRFNIYRALGLQCLKLLRLPAVRG